MFRFNRHHQGAYYLSLLKLQLFKQSVKTHSCGWFGGVAAPSSGSVLFELAKVIVIKIIS
jgi:hypothetical protein